MYAFPLDAADGRGGELAETVGANDHGVTGMDHTGSDDARYDGADEGNAEGVIDMELKWGLGVVMAVVRQDVQEGSDMVESFACDVADLEDGADTLTDELRGCRDGLLVRGDEDGDFAGARGFEDAGKLGDRLLEDLRWANVDFSDDYHHRDIEGEGDAQMFFGHTDETIVGCDHEQAVVGAG